MSTEKNTSPPAAASGDAAAPPQQPSLYARKLLQKLSTLQPPASAESREAIASWIVFNRKKCDGVGEGMLAYIARATCDDGDGGGGGASSSARLMLLLRILHAVLVSNRPAATSVVPGGGDAGSPSPDNVGDGADDNWGKSSQLRTRLGEIVVVPLWRALATSSAGMDDDATRIACRDEVRSVIEEWREHNVFGGPTVWEEYRRGWTRALREASAVVVAAAATSSADEANGGNDGNSGYDMAPPTALNRDDPVREILKNGGQQAPGTREVSAPNDGTDSVDIVDEKRGERGESDEVVDTTSSASSFAEEIGNDKAVRAATRESVASVDVEIDFEGVEAAKVEPSQFLEACKVIASIQISRDLGSDAAMNLSSALSGIPLEVEKACNVILAQQQTGQNEITHITDIVSVESLSNLPDEVLDLDIKYARQSLQMYRDAIRQQRMARLQCLHLLLQSRCSFGSMEAARAFCGGDVGHGSMNVVLERLKKMKEILVDAMALEGLDVEEDEEEKKLDKEEEELKPLSWFPEPSVVDDKVAVEEPAEKRIKIL